MRPTPPRKKIAAKKAARPRPVATPAPAPVIAYKADSEIMKMLGEIKKVTGAEVKTARHYPVANHIPTGAFMLDYALLGGVPERYATMIFGKESGGKTTLAKRIVGEFQKKAAWRAGLTGSLKSTAALWVDTEHMFDRDWAIQLKVDVDRLYLAQPANGQEAVDSMEAAQRALEMGLIVLDSIPACISKNILDKSAEDLTMTELARLMGVHVGKSVMNMNKEHQRDHHVTQILLNQWRDKPGVTFGDSRYTPGGKQINHFPTTRIEIKNKEEMGEDSHGNEVVEYNQHTFKIHKAKHGSSIRNGTFSMVVNRDNAFGLETGEFDNARAVCTMAKRVGILTGGGANWKIATMSSKFGSIDSLVQHFRNNDRDLTRAARLLIAMQRAEKGLPELPPDGYLLGDPAILGDL